MNVPIADDRGDEILGEYLDQYIDSIQDRGMPMTLSPEADGKLQGLREVADRLHKLEQFLTTGPATPSTAKTPSEREPVRPVDSRWTAVTQIGKYGVVEVLGAGGQGVTYKAWDPDLKRHVVLKLYHAARSAAQQEAVLKEGQALARVRSPYVAHCHAVERWAGPEDAEGRGIPYLVVEYIPGQSLSERQQRQPLTLPQALELTGRVAEGLAAVHACGLLHRDVKPGNILVGDDGLPRLVDFGLARSVGDEALKHISGTLAYMAPEQARGELERTDPRTDLFGLGAVLYSLVTGGPPYQAKDQATLWQMARAGDIVPARERNPKLPRAVNELCMRCLAKDPSGRFGSAAELVQAIGRLQGWRWFRPWLVGAAAAAMLLVAVGLWKSHPFDRVTPQPVPAAPNADETAERPEAGRHDFPIQVELVGARKDSSGRLYRITEGQLLSVRIESPVPCWVGIWDYDADGKVIQLFPNDEETDHRVGAGKARLIPGEAAFQIRAKVSKGPEQIRVLASTEPWSPVAGRKLGPYVVFATPDELTRLRTFEVEAKAKAVSEKVFQIQVQPR